MFDENMAEQILERISFQLSTNKSSSSSLFDQRIGNLLFQIEYSEYTKSEDCIIDLQYEIRRLSQQLFFDKKDSFYFGGISILWFFKYLEHKKIISYSDLSYLHNLHVDDLFVSLNNFSKSDNFDLLEGGNGVLNYLLFFSGHNSQNSFSSKHKGIIQAYVKRMCGFIKISIQNAQKNVSYVDLGIPHGILGSMKLSMACIKANIAVQEAISLLNYVISFFLSISRYKKGNIYFPHFYGNTGSFSSNSRLGWCNGDLMIGFALFQASKIVNNKEANLLSTNILETTCKRKTLEESQIRDACLCHGSSGLGYIYKKIWEETKNNSFRSCSSFWIQKTMKEFYLSESHSTAFKRYDRAKDLYVDDYTFFYGIAGIGLVLLTELSPSSKYWDQVLLLD